MVDTLSGGWYGVVAQPLTEDYLAKQLPMFQPKVPTLSQSNLKFPTNSPLNLPSPPLYPGEVIMLQQHRVVCMDSFSEPAVGAAYVSNFRIIFYGNLISDPESIDDFHDSHRKVSSGRKDSQGAAIIDQSPSPAPLAKLGKFKPFSATKGEPTFISFLTGGGSDHHDTPKESAPIAMPVNSGRQQGRLAKTHTQRLKSGLKKMSLRRSPQNRKKPVPRSLPSDLTDGVRDESGRDIQLAAGDSTTSPADSKFSSSSFCTGSQPNTESLESISISSASEFSATGTDDRSTSSPLGDGDSIHSGAIDILAERVHLSSGSPRIDLSDSPIDMSLESCESGFLTADIGGIAVQKPKPLPGNKAVLASKVGKGSTLPRMSKSYTVGGVSAEKQVSISLLPPVKPDRNYSKRKRANACASSIVEPESDSDTENEETEKCSFMQENPRIDVSRSSTLDDGENPQTDGHSRSSTLKANEVGSLETLVNTSSIQPPPSAAVEEDSSRMLAEREVASKAETTPTGSSSVTSPNTDHPPSESVPTYREDGVSDLSQVSRTRSNSSSKRALPIASIDLVLRHSNTSPFKPVTRKRSMSNSPHVRKKPKPLPRLSVKKFDVEDKEKREALFISSLPADFKPTPTPRVHQRSGSGKERGDSLSGNDGDKRKEDHVGAGLENVTEDIGAVSNGDEDIVEGGYVLVSDRCINNDGGEGVDDVPGGVSLNVEQDGVSRTECRTSEGKEVSANAGGVGNGGCSRDYNSSDGVGNVCSGGNVCNGEDSNSKANDANGVGHDASRSEEIDHISSGGSVSGASKSLSSDPPVQKDSQQGSSEQSSGESGCMSPTDLGSFDPSISGPVRPPRKKRNTKIKKEAISLPVTPDHRMASNGTDDIPSSGSFGHTLCDQSPARTSLTSSAELIDDPSAFKDRSSDSTSSKSRDQDGSESGRSQDIDVSNEKYQDLPLFHDEEDEPVSPLVEGLRSSHMRGVLHGQLQSRSSQNSLTVWTGSTPSSYTAGLSRPYSMLLSGDDSFMHGGQRSSDLFAAGGFSLPRQNNSVGGAVLWNNQTLDYKQSVKLSHASTRYSLCISFPLTSVHSVRKLPSVLLKEHNMKLPEGLLILSRNFHSMRLHIHPFNTYDADAFKELLDRKFLSQKSLHELFAFQYRAAIRHPNPTFLQNRNLPSFFRLAGEMCRLGLQNVQLWNVRRILAERPDLCPSYPTHVIVPSCMGDLDLIRGASLYKENRFPTLTWYNSCNGAALLRAGGTKEERGQFGTNLQTDEAMLQAISGCKLSHSGPPMTVHIFTEKPEYGLKERNAEQVRTYYYHNCKFNYASNPATFKNVRHSFNKLQALLESKLPDEDYFLAMDSTQWLPRISLLLSTAFDVCQALKKDGDHVLVCYECGWDRTTQVVSLAELLMDPYYRTMDGFQVLVQKEWVWFGHPFQLRHSRYGKTKEDGPLFLQWADCVWQIMQQCPSAFEFNERLLISMVEHSYSGLFGTFITNSERERKKIFSEKGYEHISVSSHTVSFWMWVNMVNAAGRTFYNEVYDASSYGDVIEPQWSVPCLKLWSSHYCKHKPKERFLHTSLLQAQLDGLQTAVKELEAVLTDLSPVTSYTEERTERDDLQQSTASTRSRGNSNRPPAPPPKPSAVKQYKYESLEEYLTQTGFDINICKQLTLGQSTCQGSLYKLGAKRKNWLQRWFVLDFNCQYLAYFENQQAYSNKENPKGVIRLGEINRVFQDEKKRDHLIKNIFMVVTPHRVYQMQAPSIISMYIWIACLQLSTSDLKLGAL